MMLVQNTPDMHDFSLGIYLHIPFCQQKCPYCAFYSTPKTDKIDAYVDALTRNIAYYGNGQSVDTVYFGGGTPSLLTAQQIDLILTTIAHYFTLSPTAEITLESNPATLPLTSLSDYAHAGINRLSVGVQSLDDEQLKLLGRRHTAADALSLIDAAAPYFPEISADVILATPHQTPIMLDKTLSTLVQMPLTHLSAYLLEIHPHTPFDSPAIINALPDEDKTAALYLQMVETLKHAGFLQYETSNFAPRDHESRHNLKYWHCTPYLGIGPSAHSLYENIRFFCPNNLDAFLETTPQPTIIEDASPDLKKERLMLELRLATGVPLADLADSCTDTVARLEKANLLRRLPEARVALTPSGQLVSNTIIASLLPD